MFNATLHPMRRAPANRVSSWFGRAGAIGALALALLVAEPALAQSARPDFSGYWELGAGGQRVSPPKLTTQAQAAAAKRAADLAAFIANPETRNQLGGDGGWCEPNGVPFIHVDSAPIDIIQNDRMLAILVESHSPSRTIYLDARQHPSRDQFVSPSGHSVGRWEGDTLVVHTTNFPQREFNVGQGGRRTPTSSLTERYRLVENREALSLTFTWEDPNVYAEPYTYELIYHRPKETLVSEYFCDASDESGRLIFEDPEEKLKNAAGR